MGLITKPYTFSNGATIVAAEHNDNFDTLYNLVNGNIDNANVKASAGIVDTKLAQITTGGKVSGAALTSLANIPVGAGTIPTTNLNISTNNLTDVSTTNAAHGQVFVYNATSSNFENTLSLSGLYTFTNYFTLPATTPPNAYSPATKQYVTDNSSLSNVLFSFSGAPYQGASYGFFLSDTNYGRAYWGVTNDATHRNLIRTKFTKAAAVNTVTVYVLTESGGEAFYVTTNIGGQSNSITNSSNGTPTWSNCAVNVSGLSNGTTYEVVISAAKSGGNTGKLYSVIGIGS